MKREALRILVIVGVSLYLAKDTGATAISGSIGFSGSYTPNSTPLAAATSVSFPDARIGLGTQLGSYTNVPAGTALTLTAFTFSPPASSVIPLWAFTYRGTTYSFNATSMSATYNGVLNNWNIGGSGTAYITGFDPTPGMWNLTLSNVGSSFSFAESTGVIPEPSTFVLTGLGLAAIALRCCRSKK